MCLPCHLLLVPCNAWASCKLSCTHHQECMGNAWEFMDFFQCYGCSTSGNTHCKGGYIINPHQYTYLGLGWTTVEKCICRSRILVEDKVVEATVGMAEKMKKLPKYNTSSWSTMEAKFMAWGFEVAQETWPLENLHSRKRCHVGSHVIFSFMLEVLQRINLGHSVTPHHKEPICNKPDCSIPISCIGPFLNNALLHHRSKVALNSHNRYTSIPC